jgi:hypothetical protein
MATEADSNVIELAGLRGIELGERTDSMIAQAVRAAGETNQAVAERAEWMRGILSAIRDYAASAGLGVKGVAVQVPRCSYSALSEIYNGKYKGDVLAVCQRLGSFLAAREKARIYGRETTFVPTRIGQGVERLLAGWRLRGYGYLSQRSPRLVPPPPVAPTPPRAVGEQLQYAPA